MSTPSISQSLPETSNPNEVRKPILSPRELFMVRRAQGCEGIRKAISSLQRTLINSQASRGTITNQFSLKDPEFVPCFIDLSKEYKDKQWIVKVDDAVKKSNFPIINTVSMDLGNSEITFTYKNQTPIRDLYLAGGVLKGVY